MGWMKRIFKFKRLIGFAVLGLLLGSGQVALSFDEPMDSKRPRHLFEIMKHHKGKKGQAIKASSIASLGSSPVKLTTHQLNVVSSNSWSVNNEILFISDRGGNVDLWRMNQNGGNLTRLTNDYYCEWWDFLWSPDGSKIAYVAYDFESGLSRLFVMNADGSGRRELLSSDGDIGELAWSPDSIRIAYVRESDPKGKDDIWVINADGTGNTQLTTDGDSDHPSWSPDGTKIAYHSSGPGPEPSGIYIMDQDGGNKTFLVEGYDPAWSPDGEWVAYSRWGPEEVGIWKIRPNGSEETRLTTDTGWNLFWTPDSRKILYRKSGSIIVIMVDGSQSWILLNGETGLGISPDGSKVVYSNYKDIYTMSIGPPPGNPIRLTNNQYLAGNYEPIWSPDGQKILYEAFPNQEATEAFWSSGGLCVMEKDGLGKREILVSGADNWVYGFAWSPDSTKIAYIRVSNRGGAEEIWKDSDIWVINADGTGNTRLTTDGDSDHPSWSPDGTKIAYYGLGPEPGLSGIYIMDQDGGNKTFLVEGDDPVWSPDGGWVAYSRWCPEETAGIWKIRPNGSDNTRLTTGECGDPTWSPDGSMIAYSKYVDDVDDKAELWIVKADGSANWQVYRERAWDYAWSPDSSKIAFITDDLIAYMIGINGQGLIRINANNTLCLKVDWSRENILAYEQNLDIWINDLGAPPPLLSITTTSLSNGVQNVVYSQTLEVTGGVSPYTWSIVSGSPPPGLSLNSTTGLISGTPTKSGTFNFTVKVTDSSSPKQEATKELLLNIAGENPVLTVVSIFPDKNTPSIVMQGGTLYRCYRILKPDGQGFPGAEAFLSKGSDLGFKADGEGNLTIYLEADKLSNSPTPEDLPVKVSFSALKAGDTPLEVTSYPEFDVIIKKRTSKGENLYGASYKGSIGIIGEIGAEVRTGLALGSLRGSPFLINEDFSFLERSLEGKGEVGAGVSLVKGKFNLGGVLYGKAGAEISGEAGVGLNMGDTHYFTNLLEDLNQQAAFSLLALENIARFVSPLPPLIKAFLERGGKAIFSEGNEPAGVVLASEKIETTLIGGFGIGAELDVGLFKFNKSGINKPGRPKGYVYLKIPLIGLVFEGFISVGQEEIFEGEDKGHLKIYLHIIGNSNLDSIVVDFLNLVSSGSIPSNIDISNSCDHKFELIYHPETMKEKEFSILVGFPEMVIAYTLKGESNIAKFSQVSGGSLLSILRDSLNDETPSLLNISVDLLKGELKNIINSIRDSGLPFEFEIRKREYKELEFPLELEVALLKLKIGLGGSIAYSSGREYLLSRGVVTGSEGVKRSFVTEKYGDDGYNLREWTTLTKVIKGGLESVWNKIKDTFSQIISDIKEGVGNIFENVAKTTDGVIKGSVKIVGDAATWVGQRTVEIISWTEERIPKKVWPMALTIDREQVVIGIGGYHQFTPEGTVLNAPATLTITYIDDDVRGLDESKLAIYYWNYEKSGWEKIGGEVDPVNNSISASITTFRIYTIGYGVDAVFGKVVNPDNQPIKDVRIELLKDGIVEKFTLTDSKGDYWVSGLSGTYSMRASKEGYVTQTKGDITPGTEVNFILKIKLKHHLSANFDNEVLLPDKTKILIPKGALSSDTYLNISSPNQKDMPSAKGRQATGVYRDFSLENGQTQFLNNKMATIWIPYNDVDNNNGVVDGTEIKEDNLKVFFLKGTDWIRDFETEIDAMNNLAVFKTPHLTIFGLFGMIAQNLDDVVVYPNPFKPSKGHTEIRFERLTENVTIRIYNIAGELVRIQKDITTGYFDWDARNDSGKKVASGVYIYIITDSEGRIKKGKMAIIR